MTTLHRFRVEKLIRHIVSERLSSTGIVVHKKDVTDAEFVGYLKEKLIEEAKEVATAKDQADLIEEMGDVLQVMHVLCRTLNIPLSAVEDARASKEVRSGSFSKDTYCTHVDVPRTHPNYPEYKSRPDDYPEMVGA